MEARFVVYYADNEVHRWSEAEAEAHADLLRPLRTLDGALVLEGTAGPAPEPEDEWDVPEEPEPIQFTDELWAVVVNLCFWAPVALARDGVHEYRATSWSSRLNLRRDGADVVLEGTHLATTRIPADELLPGLRALGERFLSFTERLYGAGDGRVVFLRKARDEAVAALGPA